MIGYVTLGTNDLARSTAFYDALLAEVGAKRFLESGRSVAWRATPDTPGLAVYTPFDGKPATVGNGAMIGLKVDSTAKVDALYRKALALGGTDEGPPGPRGTSGYYGAYFRDLDGNKLSAYTLTGA